MRSAIVILIILTIIFPQVIFSQNVTGKVTEKSSGESISGVLIKVKGSSGYAVSNGEGNYELKGMPVGEYTIIIDDTKWQTTEYQGVVVNENGDTELNIQLSPKNYRMDNITVYGASRTAEKITESPAAVNSLTSEDIRKSAREGQIARALNGTPGIDVLQNGATDYIVNARGFNSGLNRRILVLQDGRDVAMPLLGAMEWNSFSMPLDEFSNVELVRGPSASLYGPNAFNGVLNLRSFSPREILGTKASFMGGENENFRGDLRHAGLMGNFSYKVNIGSQSGLNYSKRRDSAQFLEYDGIALERRVLTDDDRNTFSHYGSLRMDYNIDDDERIVGEFGYSRNGNETFVFGLGRTLVKDVERPYLRFGYNSPRINLHAHYMQRSVKDTMWLMVPNVPLLDDSKDLFLDAQHNFFIGKDMHIVWGVSQQYQFIRTSGTSIPDDVDANYTGLYGQFEWKFSKLLKLVASVRTDFASIHETQFSPRAALVLSPLDEHQFRLSVGRSFQRPNYSELYRLTADAPAFTVLPDGRRVPINFNNVEQKIADSIATLSGGPSPDLNLGLSAFNAQALGNDNLKVEKNIGIEAGYKGIISNSFFVTVDVYYNQLTDFITNFLPAVNEDIAPWEPGLEGELEQYNDLVKDMVMDELSPRDQQRLSMLNGVPTFVVSNTNVGEVEQYGIDIGLNYYLTDEMLVSANYSYYDFEVTKKDVNQPLYSNTSPHKVNIKASYTRPRQYDIALSFNYTEGYDWLAGTYVGYVPSYNYFNINAGYYILDNLEIGVNIFNVFNNELYQVFGGTYLPRYSNVKLTWEL